MINFTFVEVLNGINAKTILMHLLKKIYFERANPPV